MEPYLPSLTVAALVGAGLVTGILFAFSNFALQALAELEDEHGMFAMQRINARIQNPLFLLLFLGTPLVCVAILFAVASNLGATSHLLLGLGASLYLLGPFGMTLLFNVPLNEGLDRRQRHEAPHAWPAYRVAWQRWNHARSYLGILAIVFLAAGGVAVR